MCQPNRAGVKLNTSLVNNEYILRFSDFSKRVRCDRRLHVSVSNLKKWNHLKSDNIRDGQKLIIKKKQ